MDINCKLKNLIISKAKVDKEIEILDNLDLVYDLGLDSLSLVELIVDIELEFGIDIGENDLDKVYKYGTLLKYINEHVE